MSDKPFLEEFSAENVGANRLRLTLDESTLTPVAGGAVLVNVDYSGAEAEGGTVLPLELVVQTPTVDGFRRREYRRSRPNQIAIFPVPAGPHLLMLRETGHNLFFGSLTFDVGGDVIDPLPPRRGPTA